MEINQDKEYVIIKSIILNIILLLLKLALVPQDEYYK